MDEEDPKNPLYTEPTYPIFPQSAKEELLQMQSETDFKGAIDFMKSNNSFSQQSTFVDLNSAGGEAVIKTVTDEAASFTGEANRNEQFYQQQPVQVPMVLQHNNSQLNLQENMHMGNALGLLNATPKESTILQQTQLQSQISHQQQQLAQQQQQIEHQQKQLAQQQQCLQVQIKQPLYMQIEPTRSPSIQAMESKLDAMLGQNMINENPSISPHDSIHNPFIDKSPVISPQLCSGHQNTPNILPKTEVNVTQKVFQINKSCKHKQKKYKPIIQLYKWHNQWY
jgi:hypothetical protein